MSVRLSRLLITVTAGQDFGDDATFAQYGAGFANKGDWRRNNIDLLIQEMDARVHAAKPWVKFGVSPFGIWRNKAADPLDSDTNGTQSYDANLADTRKWVKEGWIDYIVPQQYPQVLAWPRRNAPTGCP